MIADRGPALPALAVPYRTIGPFEADTIPAGLLRRHDLKPGVWAVLTVVFGTIRFCWDDEAGGERELVAGEAILVPPRVPHHLERRGPVTLDIAFHAPPDTGA